MAGHAAKHVVNEWQPRGHLPPPSEHSWVAPEVFVDKPFKRLKVYFHISGKLGSVQDEKLFTQFYSNPSGDSSPNWQALGPLNQVMLNYSNSLFRQVTLADQMSEGQAKTSEYGKLLVFSAKPDSNERPKND